MKPPDSDQLDAMSSLLEHVVDSFEKLEVVVHLYRTRFTPQDISSIGRTLQLPPNAVAQALTALLQAGIVRTSAQGDSAEWWFAPATSWVTTIEVLVEIYEANRGELLGLMKHVAFEHVRAHRAPGWSFPAMRTRRTPTVFS
jgi:hypothetical protein